MKIGRIFRHFRVVSLATIILIGADSGLVAQQNSESEIGAVTKLPLPRYISLKANEANVRRGPSKSHRIDWVLVRKGTPLQVTAEFESWRRVRDVDGAGGWVHFKLLSNARTVLITSTRVPLYADPSQDSTVIALAEKGVIGELGNCSVDWCEIDSGGYSGWILKANLWGVGENEVRN